jgi:Ni,Fe-hydrogenase III small subunit
MNVSAEAITPYYSLNRMNVKVVNTPSLPNSL